MKVNIVLIIIVKLNDLADGVARFGYTGATLIAISFLFKQFVMDQKYSLEAIKTYVSMENWHAAFHDVVTCLILAIIVIVVAVPEGMGVGETNTYFLGLPMMIAIVLSLNMRKLLKANVLVRKLLGIETAGSLNILFVDKTGTLTKGIFEPNVFVTGDVKSYSSAAKIPTELNNALTFCLSESTSVVLGGDGQLIGGNASDRALIGFISKDSLKTKTDTTPIKEILFNSARKFSAVQLRVNKDKPRFITGNDITIVKGAPDILLSSCKTYYDESGKPQPIKVDALTREMDKLSETGTRVIAIATSTSPLGDNIPNDLCLVGIIGIVDEIRKESKPAIELAQKAGIQVVMITGDRKETAVSVAEQLGLFTTRKEVLTSSQLKNLSDAELQAKIPNLAVIARALPTDKSRLVRVCQEQNLVVGMTG
jgi:magnesium-transporting ATPase (P-type)